MRRDCSLLNRTCSIQIQKCYGEMINCRLFLKITLKLNWRHCHVVEFQSNEFDLVSGSRNRGRNLPYAYRFVAKLAKCFSGNHMTLDVDGTVNWEKSLGWSRRFETLHSSLSSTNRQVRTLYSIVLSATKVTTIGKIYFSQYDSVRR